MKIRWQLQLEVISPSLAEQHIWNQGYMSKYQSFQQTFRQIFAEEGIPGFWKGHLSGQLLAVTYNTVQFVLFKSVSWELKVKGITFGDRFTEKFVVGGVSGCGATISAMPFDVIRTRLVSQCSNHKHETLRCAPGTIYRNEGLSGFFRGLKPALLQTFPAAGLSFGFYYKFESILNPILPSSLLSFVAGALSGTAVKFCIHPLDVYKKRLIIQGFPDARKQSGGRHAEYHGMIDCAVTMVREEGFKGMFKGLTPNVIKGAISTGLSFGFFELYCALLLPHSKSIY